MDEVLSPCCSAEISVTRNLSDVGVYAPERLEGDTLHVSFVKTYEGESDAFEATCTKCGNALPYWIEED
jgi:hypothetical protein